MLAQYQFTISTPGRGIFDVTENIKELVAQAQVTMGLCHVFLHHTSASVILCENFDPLVHRDLEAFMVRLIPDADPLYQHVEEGPDDMPSHVRTVLTSSFLMLPVTDGKLALGKWQGIYLYEHRIKNHERRFTVTIQGN